MFLSPVCLPIPPPRHWTLASYSMAMEHLNSEFLRFKCDQQKELLIQEKVITANTLFLQSYNIIEISAN